MEYNEESLLDQEFRAQIIEETLSEENNERKEKSLEDTDVYTGQIHDYVLKRFEDKGYTESTLCSIPIVSTINVSKKVVDNQAGVYKQAPKRTYSEVTEEQLQVIEEVYTDAWVDAKMLGSNRLFKLQQQTHILIEPVDGMVKLKNLKQHSIDVLPHYLDPEKPLAYIISSYDKSLSDLYDQSERSDGFNQKIADRDDYKKESMRFIWWSDNYHFVTNGHGVILGKDDDNQDIANPIGIIPIVEISEDKDHEYFIQDRNLSTQFTVDYNEALSNNGHIVHMQGFAQAYIKAPQDLMPESLTIGPTKILKLITDPNADQNQVDFGFATPGSDLAGAKEYTDSLLAQFLSSIGLDPSAITSSSGQKLYSSGTERLLALIENFDATRTDFSRYEYAEKKMFKVIARWMNALRDTDMLNDKYKTSEISDNASVSVEFKRPEQITSDAEKLDVLEREKDLGIVDRVKIVEKYKNMTKEEAEEYLDGLETEDNFGEDARISDD